jgi:SecD/SecF fusion protein
VSRRGNLAIIALVVALLVGTVALVVFRSPVLGLDLEGGAEVVLEATPEEGQEVTPQMLDQAVGILRDRVDALGVAEPEIRKEEGNRISVAVAGEQDPQRVFNLVGSTGKLYFIDLEEGLTQGVSRSVVEGAGITPKESLHDLLKAAEPQAKRDGASEIYAFQEEKAADGSSTWKQLNPNGAANEEELKQRLEVAELPAGTQVLGVPKGKLAVSCSSISPAGCPPDLSPNPDAPEKLLWYMFDIPPADQLLTGSDLDDARADFDTRTSQPIVTMDFDGRGGRVFEEITNKLADRGRNLYEQAVSQGQADEGSQDFFLQRFAVVLDNELTTFPTIDFRDNPDGIKGGSAQITGLDSAGEAKNIALVLQSGSLPVEFQPLSTSLVSATLGDKSLNEGLIAGIAGLLIVMIYMIIFYRFLGLIADIALLIFAALFYGVILAIPVTMTLPGIAGVILTIGVAADANVVIFERIKEEVRAGKTVRAAIQAGYSKGFKTIIDANTVTLITAAVLFVASTASVKGFAFLLGLGVLVSMFSAVASTRAMLGILGNFKWFNNAAFMGADPKPVRWKMDFAGRKRLWFVISGVAIAVSLGSLVVNGLNEGIDFKGGTRMNVELERPATTNEVRTVLGDVDSGLSNAVIRGRGETRGQDEFTEFQIDAEEIPNEDVQAFTQGLRVQYGVADTPDVRSVSASFGSEILRGAILAIVFSILLIVVYIAFRFDWRYAAPMIAALLHDLVITIGVYSLFGLEVSSATVAAVLTILGYSLYDTIIIFDRVRENEQALRKHTYDEIVNISLWETATRSLNTSFITLLPILSLFIFGGETLRDFAFALLIGIACGAYSSFFIAAPLLAVIKGRQPQFRGRTGTHELPSFLRRASEPSPAPAAPEPVTAGRGAATAVAEAERDVPEPSDAPAARPPAEPVDDADAEARAAARARRADRKTRRRPHGRSR